VTFHTKEGGERSYEYEGFAAAQILAGADPAHLSGREVPTRFGGDPMDALELAAKLAEISIEL
jgi:hypothetical protein